MMIRSLNYFRVIAMISIVACHFLQYFGNSFAFFLNGGVYCFLMISGVIFGLRKITDVRKFYIKRLTRILIPYAVLLVIYAIIFMILQGRISGKIIWNILCLQWVTGGLEGAGHLWFVTCIILCYLTVPLLERAAPLIKKRNAAFFWIAMALLALASIFAGRVISRDLLTVYVFVFGYFYSSKYGYHTAQNGRPFDISVILFGAVLLVGRVVVEIFVGQANTLIGNVQEILSAFAFMRLLSRYLDGECGGFLIQRIFDPLMNAAGRYSYDIYLMHHMFILGPLSVMQLTGLGALNILLAVILSVASGVLLHGISALPLRLLSKHGRSQQ